MAPLAVDPEALDSAGVKVISVSEGLTNTVSTLTSALAGCHGMSGDDPVGAAFGHSYDASVSKLLEAMATTRNGLSRLGDGVRLSAHNYSVAETNSNLAGGKPLPNPPETAGFSADASPTAVGHGMSAPAGWGWVSKYIGMIWPTANSAKLRDAAAAWTEAGIRFEVAEITGAVGPMTTIAQQRIPEGPAIAAAFTETHRCAARVLQQCTVVAAQLSTYATKVDTVHVAIIDLLSRICNPLTGIKEVWEFLTNDDEDEIQKIAHDIRVVVDHFTAEVDALRTQITSTLNEAAAILNEMARYAEKEWDHFLHSTNVGRALNHIGQICDGVVEEAESTIKGFWTLNPARAVVDPPGFWRSVAGALDKLEKLTGCDGERALEDAWKQLGKDAVHWDEWGTNPFKAAGESVFDLGTLLLPGGALDKLPTIARAATDIADAPKTVHVPEPSRLPNPAPHDNEPVRNSPPSNGQPMSAPKATSLPAYGLNDSKPATSAQKASMTSESKPLTAPDRTAPLHTSNQEALSWAHQRPTDSLTASAAPSALPVTTTPGLTQTQPSPTVYDREAVASSDAPLHGLTDSKRDEILALPKGSRPDPSEYLTPDYVERHARKFDEGGTRFMLRENLDRYGIGQGDGTAFVFPTSQVDSLMIVGGASGIERTLGLPEGYLQDFDAVRVDIPSAENQNLRIPSGNEAGANDYWAPGGLLPGGMLEAVIDVASVPKETLTIVDLRETGEL